MTRNLYEIISFDIQVAGENGEYCSPTCEYLLPYKSNKSEPVYCDRTKDKLKEISVNHKDMYFRCPVCIETERISNLLISMGLNTIDKL